MADMQLWSLQLPRTAVLHCRRHVPARGQRTRQHAGLHPGAQHVMPAIELLNDQLQSLHASYMFVGATAALLQGVQLPDGHQCLSQVQLTVQWDYIKILHTQLAAELQQSPAAIAQGPAGRKFTATVSSVDVEVSCELNTVLQMNPHRVVVQHGDRQLWCESLLSVRQSAPAQLAAAVTSRLAELQGELTKANARAWSQCEAVDAWMNKVGSPNEAAAWIQKDPLLRLGAPLYKHLPSQMQGLHIINLMGSHGVKAVAAALLGARVTCVDISPTNVQYGRQLAAAADAHVQFICSDVLQLRGQQQLTGGFDIVLLELGVLHYFVDLQPLMQVGHQLLQPGGRLLLREFHPVSTKLIESKGKRHKVTGDYFSQGLVATDVAYSKYTDGKTAAKEWPQVRLRQWGLGEVVTSIAAAGLIVVCLEEEAGVKVADAGLPKLYTVVAVKA